MIDPGLYFGSAKNRGCAADSFLFFKIIFVFFMAQPPTFNMHRGRIRRDLKRYYPQMTQMGAD